MNTLAFDYAIPAIRACSGLSPVRQCSCRAYNKILRIKYIIRSIIFLEYGLFLYQLAHSVWGGNEIETGRQTADVDSPAR